MEWGGTIPALSAVNVRQGYIDLNRTQHFGSDDLYARWMTTGRPAKGDIVFTMEAPLGNVAQIPDERYYILSQRVVLLKTQVGIDPTFLAHQMRAPHFRTQLLANSTGSTAAGISQARLLNLVLALPPSNEQRRIADKLDDLLGRVKACSERLERVQSILNQLKSSVLAAATSGVLTESWRGLSATEWPIVALSDVAKDFSYGSAAKSAAAGRIPVLRMGNIQDGQLDWDGLVYTSDPAEIEKYKLIPGDVLFNRTNSPELVGKSAVYKGERPAIYAGYLIKVRCSEVLLPDYLNYCLGSPAGRDYCWRVKSDGVSQSNINAKKLAAFEFGLPPIAEQAEIVHRVESFFALADAIEAKCKSARTQVESLTPALLSKAFRGELVPQDPADESASVLLERIKTAKTFVAPTVRRTTQTRRLELNAEANQTLLKVIDQMGKADFTFDELRQHSAQDYESLKAELFSLLADKKSGLDQYFDETEGSMKLRRVNK